MPTRLRAIFSYGGASYGGGQVRANLEYVYSKATGTNPPKRGEMPEAKRLVQMFEKVKGTGRRLFLFREPRGIVRARSRYKQLCDHYGIKARAAKKAGVLRGRNVRPPQVADRTFRVRRPPPPPNLRNRVAPAGGVVGTLGGTITIPFAAQQAVEPIWVFAGTNTNGESVFQRPTTQAPAPGLGWADIDRERARAAQEQTAAEITQRLIQQRQAMRITWDERAPEREPIDNEF